VLIYREFIAMSTCIRKQSSELGTGRVMSVLLAPWEAEVGRIVF
jgi:hypothetical protein